MNCVPNRMSKQQRLTQGMHSESVDFLGTSLKMLYLLIVWPVAVVTLTRTGALHLIIERQKTSYIFLPVGYLE